jgi:spermidine synthase
MRPDGPPAPAMGPWVAAALVFGSSGAVLVVELASLRLLAPYLGLTLETNTLVIGLALAAIAAGSWLGGRAADHVSPRLLLGPLLAVSGGAVALLPTVVRATAASGDDSVFQLVSGLAIMLPAALLSAVTPIVTTLRLTSLEETGTVVGRLSGIGTVGAIAGTVLTGFVLISLVSVSTILVGLGLLLVVASVLVDLRLRSWRGRATAAAVVALGGLGAAVSPGACDVETTYHCALVQTDPERPSGRVLVLDGLRHSYVDLEDPTHLEFEYVQAIASVVDASWPASEPLAAYHLGGGGLTLPHYLEAVRPGTRSLVSEIDPGVVAVDVERLGAELGDGIEVRVEDGRLGLRRLDADSRDLVVGDAFGGVSVPFHLATREALLEVDRVLVADGSYVANLIDHPPLDFVRAELATMRSVFDHVVLLAAPDTLAGEDGGNLVAVGSQQAVDVAAVLDAAGAHSLEWQAIGGAALDDFVGAAEVLVDDDAPVDQLLTPYD